MKCDTEKQKECSHVNININTVGQVFCENCGKYIDESEYILNIRRANEDKKWIRKQ